MYDGGKEDAAFANAFYTGSANALLYAGHKGYVPTVKFAHGRLKALGNTTWEIFFRPVCANLSRWLAACASSVRLAPSRPMQWYYPGVATHFRWPIHNWYNLGSPAHRACEARRNKTGGCQEYDDSLFRSWRLRGHAAAIRFKLNAAFAEQVDRRWRTAFSLQADNGQLVVLGVHMRGSDKKSGRRKVPSCEFDAYVQDFFSAFPTSGRLYVATESAPYAENARKWWVERWGVTRVLVPQLGTRVGSAAPNFLVHDPLHVAREVHLDIQLLARCDYLLHGASAVAEAAIYLNPRLHWNSTHLEYWNACEANQTCHDAPWRWHYHWPF